MSFERSPLRANVIDVVDHILDKGIVVDAQVDVSVAGLELIEVRARVVVASLETYRRHAEQVAQLERIESHALALRRRLAHRQPAGRQRRLEDRVREELYDERARSIGPRARGRSR
ncbi:MAG: gas vesicle protein GvpJ [Vicinamibacterales bacterium]